MSTTAPQVSAPTGRWLFGPVADLAFGCGLLYALFFVAQVVAGPTLRAWLPLSLLPFLTLLLGAPHYGATLLRVYATRTDRDRHFFFAVWVSLAVAVAFVAGLHVPWIGSAILTLYLTWSPWHYTAQNYGVASLILRRRGIALAPGTHRLLRRSFELSYLLAFLSLHGATRGPQSAAIEDYEGSVYSLLSLGIPIALRDALMIGALVGQLGCTAAAVWQIGRAGRLASAGPALTLLGTQAVWFLLPAIVAIVPSLAAIEPFSPEHRGYAFMWIAVGHFLQYLWITTYYAASSESGAGQARHLAKALLAGISIWALPGLLFAPGLLGPLPYDLGLGLLAASAVNIHHFILDGVIWRLRDDRIARMLLGSRTERSGPAASGGLEGSAPNRLRAFGARLGWALACGVLAAALFASWETQVGNRAAESGDFARYALAVERRAWLGRDGPEPHLLLGIRAMQSGDLATARRELDRGMRLHPTADLWRFEGELAEREGDPGRALAAFERALELDPGSAPAYYQAGRLLAGMGRLDDAIARLERADEIWPDTPPIDTLLAELRARRDGTSAKPAEAETPE